MRIYITLAFITILIINNKLLAGEGPSDLKIGKITVEINGVKAEYSADKYKVVEIDSECKKPDPCDKCKTEKNQIEELDKKLSCVCPKCPKSTVKTV